MIAASPSPTAHAAAEARSPFARLNDLLAPVQPGQTPILLSVGEPQHAVPDFVGPVLAKNLSVFNRYPANTGTDEFRQTVAGWLGRRYALARPMDWKSEILVLAGTREGLFLSAIVAARALNKANGAILIPNPFYAAYAAGADAAHCEAVYLPATAQSGFLPDLDALDAALLSRTVAIYLASPANPQGAVADADYLRRLIALARKHDFMIFADECYSEIYSHDAPPGILEVAQGDFRNVVGFQSLSKRSNLAGLRVGFIAGDAEFLRKLLETRNVSAPQVPMALQAVAVAAYSDEAHVDDTRAQYKAKFDLADQIIGGRYGYQRPAGGFFLWLDVSAQGGSEAATLKLWREAGVRVVPGRYLARNQKDGSNPGENYIRVALVQDKESTAEALHRLVAVLG